MDHNILRNPLHDHQHIRTRNLQKSPHPPAQQETWPASPTLSFRLLKAKLKALFIVTLTRPLHMLLTEPIAAFLSLASLLFSLIFL
jgi:hypothetical protein